ncbi:MAG TPA: hypothetical protein VLT33_25335, partial [Labilithrix sp.]|nr:hypothetical protein [Labilithrix sp.]
LVQAPFAATDALARLVLGASQWVNPLAPPPPAPPHAPGGIPPFPAPAGVPVPEAPPSEPTVAAPHMPTGAEVAAAIEAETAQVHGQVVDVADDVARLRREIEALKRSMNGAAARPKKRAAKKTASRKR